MDTLAAAVAELDRLVDAQGAEIVRLNGRLDAANEALVVLEARLMLVNAAFNRYLAGEAFTSYLDFDAA